MVRSDSSSDRLEEAVVPRPAATVMLVRDGRTGVEVFLMKRSGFGMFGGLHVFPGGKIDGADRAARWGVLASGPDDSRASEMLGLSTGGLDYWIACIRECFEEAGVLLATDTGGAPLQLVDPDVRERFGHWRDRLNAREPGALAAMCAEEELRLATDQLAYVSHWITPIDQPTRFDTRFFVARAPSEQIALHDGHETVHSEWIRPELALERFANGQLNLISPTENNLKALVGFASTEVLVDAKRKVDPRSIPTIIPRIRRRNATEFDEVLEIAGHGGKSSGS